MAEARADSKSVDRRVHPRRAASWPCKLRPEAGVRYAPGRVLDIAPGGALIELHSPRSVQRGDSIELLMDSARRVVIERADAVSGRVVRVEPGLLGACRVAVRFEAPIALSDRVGRAA